MKLASLKNNTRDGELVLVSRDLSRYVTASDIAPTLQYLLDHWQDLYPLVQARENVLRVNADGSNGNTCDSKVNTRDAKVNTDISVADFDPQRCASPLPRAYQWADGSAYVNHVELVRKARGATMPESFWSDPLMYQGGSDKFLGPCDPIVAASESWGIDLEAEVAVITDEVPMGIDASAAGKLIRLVLLVNDVSLRSLIPGELAKGFGFFQSKPSSAFSPVAVTPDELGECWDGHKLHLPLCSWVNDSLLGQPDAGVDMVFDFPTLIAHAARTRTLAAGTIIGSGTVSNRDCSVGSSCLAEVRMIETIETGAPITPFLRFGDQIRIEMLDPDGVSIFGAIVQRVLQAPGEQN
ncbi:MAG: fumarylacetoacetate hydrolase family protein [Pseudomonadales bacterium]|nr:fumarylacetoacetate hydrolase family protein [Pseudomonadales bacterium]